MKFLLKIVAVAVIILSVSCSQGGGKNIDSNTADSLRKDSLAKVIIHKKDSIAHLSAEIAASSLCDTNIVDSIILQFDY